jgi:uncharacterized protein (TIGR02246 family)
MSLCVLIAGLSISANGSGRERKPKERASRDALARVSAEWDARFDAGDAVGLSALYAVDAVSMPYDAPALRGRAALRADFASFFASNTSQRHETHVEAIVIRGDLAIERARYTLRYAPKNGSGEVVETGKHLECRRRINGRWQIIYEIWNRDAAPSTPRSGS